MWFGLIHDKLNHELKWMPVFVINVMYLTAFALVHPSGRHTYLRLETGVNDSVKINT